MEPKWLHSGAVFMSTGWPPFRYRFSTTLQRWYNFLPFFKEKRLHSGAKIVPLFEKWYLCNLFFLENYVPLWSRFGNWYHFAQRYRFFSNMIIKGGKKRLHPPKWHRFPKRLQGGAILAPLFFFRRHSKIWKLFFLPWHTFSIYGHLVKKGTFKFSKDSLVIK